MSSLNNTSIDLSVFNTDHQQQTADCNNDFKSCECIRRVLTALRYYSILNLHSNKDDQNIFSNFINTVYSASSLIMDFFHFKNIHNDEIQQIMDHALDYYKFPLCDVETCLYSSRLYRVNDAAAMIKIFDSDDKTSSLPVIISILDSVHHYTFHLGRSGLRDFADGHAADGDNKYNEDGDEYFDAEFAGMNKRILSTQKKTKRFSRLSSGKKFSINIKNNNDEQKEDEYDDLKEESDGITYLDTIYINLKKEGINKEIICKLENYVLNEQFDTESMDLDLSLEGGAGNIAATIKNDECIEYIKNMFAKSTRMIDICMIYVLYILLSCTCSYFIYVFFFLCMNFL